MNSCRNEDGNDIDIKQENLLDVATTSKRSANDDEDEYISNSRKPWERRRSQSPCTETSHPITTTENIHILCLPEEVLLEILKRLSLMERRSFRLVCQKWNQACTTYERREKLCIGTEHSRCHYNVCDIFATLSNSERQCFNFEFCQMTFGTHRYFIEFWEICGSRITSLILRDCQVSVAAFISILRCCPRLQMLELHVFALLALNKKLLYEDPNHDTDIFQFRHTALRSLKIHFQFKLCHFVFWIELLRKLFCWFPNISNFCFHDMNVAYGRTGATKYGSNPVIRALVLSEIYKYFAREEMNEISISFLGHPCFRYDILMIVDGLTNKITEIAVSWCRNDTPNSFIKFLQNQMNLRKVIAITSSDPFSLDTLVKIILNIPSLREFHLNHSKGYVDWMNNWSILLCNSHIENLSISCPKLSFENPLVPNAALFPGAKLTTLSIQVKRFSDLSDVVLHLLSLSPNLRSVRLSHVDHVVMEAACTNHIELRSFMIAALIPREGRLPSADFLCRLTQLERLGLPIYKKFLLNLPSMRKHFSRLRILHLTSVPESVKQYHEYPGGNRLSFETLQTLLQMSPLLEVVWIESCYFEFPTPVGLHGKAKWLINSIVEYSSELKYLKCLCFKFSFCPSYITIDDASVLFDHCSSLQTFVSEKRMFAKNLFGKCTHETTEVSDIELIQRYMKL